MYSMASHNAMRRLKVFMSNINIVLVFFINSVDWTGTLTVIKTSFNRAPKGRTTPWRELDPIQKRMPDTLITGWVRTFRIENFVRHREDLFWLYWEQLFRFYQWVGFMFVLQVNPNNTWMLLQKWFTLAVYNKMIAFHNTCTYKLNVRQT